LGLDPLGDAEESVASLPTFLRFVSLGTSVAGWVSFRTMRSLEEREGPKAGEEYRFRERGSLELPPPSHRYTPLGFLDRVFRGDGVIVCAEGGRPKFIPVVLAKKGEFPRAGVEGVLLENRKDSGRSAGGESQCMYDEHICELRTRSALI
jgi:hypothetical protein